MFNRVSWSSAEGGIIILPPCSRSSLSFPGSIDTEKHLENQNRIYNARVEVTGIQRSFNTWYMDYMKLDTSSSFGNLKETNISC